MDLTEDIIENPNDIIIDTEIEMEDDTLEKCEICYCNKITNVRFECQHEVCLECYSNMICNSLDNCPFCRKEIIEIKKIRDSVNTFLTNNFLYERFVTNTNHRREIQIRCCSRICTLIILLIFILLLGVPPKKDE